MPNNILLLGTRKGLLTLQRNLGDGRNQWHLVRQAYEGVPISYAFADPRTGLQWACADHGHWGRKLYRSRDEGQSWQEVSAPKYPEGEVAYAPFPGDAGSERPASLTYLWLIAPGVSDEPNRLYAGTEPGGLFVSDDNGDSFHLLRGLWDHPSRPQWFGGGRDLPGIHSIIVDPRDPQHLYIGISCAGVFESNDAGRTWQPRNKGLKATFLPDPDAEIGHDPHCLVVSPADPDVLWQQNHCGIFRSSDGGRTWSDISQPGGPAFFGFAITADEKDPQTAWVVPAISDEIRIAINGALCVCRTEDGGRTWTELRNGLPQANAYDEVFRHALDIRGNTLAFGTTTGNVYLSDDRGETWHSLGHHFPPIYSVRFA
jgi:photosystem II stability/assembly factor-like uncharacterized protein